MHLEEPMKTPSDTGAATQPTSTIRYEGAKVPTIPLPVVIIGFGIVVLGIMALKYYGCF